MLMAAAGFGLGCFGVARKRQINPSHVLVRVVCVNTMFLSHRLSNFPRRSTRNTGTVGTHSVQLNNEGESDLQRTLG